MTLLAQIAGGKQKNLTYGAPNVFLLPKLKFGYLANNQKLKSGYF